jgi:hypothetical protein
VIEREDLGRHIVERVRGFLESSHRLPDRLRELRADAGARDDPLDG